MSDPPASRAGRRKREPQAPASPSPAKWGRRFRLPARPGARALGQSCLILGTGEGGRKIHVVCARCSIHTPCVYNVDRRLLTPIRWPNASMSSCRNLRSAPLTACPGPVSAAGGGSVADSQGRFPNSPHHQPPIIEVEAADLVAVLVELETKVNMATLLFAPQPLAYARGSVRRRFGAATVRERMRNYL